MVMAKSSPRVLPDEIILEILSWLPAKSVLRFRYTKLKEAETYRDKGIDYLRLAIGLSWLGRNAATMKQADLAYECFRVVEDKCYAAALKKAAMKAAALKKAADRDAENAPDLLCCMILGFFGSVLFIFAKNASCQ
ncbi:hypothetical protein V8G54_035884 [Vigna mungo]|uniref:F-box domain-containing protein n=1 Tax=Vigna mungo TaxID=3915 RepID=A0AAQ3RG21_VIGMU